MRLAFARSDGGGERIRRGVSEGDSGRSEEEGGGGELEGDAVEVDGLNLEQTKKRSDLSRLTPPSAPGGCRDRGWQT